MGQSVSEEREEFCMYVHVHMYIHAKCTGTSIKKQEPHRKVLCLQCKLSIYRASCNMFH